MYFWEAGSVIEKLRVLEGVSSLRMDLCAKLLGSVLIAVSSTANAISPCPPVPEVPMLSLDNPDWVIAEVTVIGPISQAEQFSEGAALVRVDRVYAGQLSTETIIVEEDRGFFDCTGAFVPNDVEGIGQRFLLGMAGPNANGSYGGLQALSVRRIIFSEIIGGIPGFQTDTANPSTDEFANFLNTLTPRAETDDYRLSITPRLPSRSDKPSLKIEANNGTCLDSATANAVVVDHASGVAQVSFSPEYAEVESCDYRVPASIALPAFERTRNEFYTVSVYEEDIAAGESPFQSDNLVAEIEYTLREAPSFLANPEVPAQDSVQSGVGVIRGWACDAQRVEVRFNDLAPIPIAYGTIRTDTREVCGDSNNGYGAVYAWGLLGAGQHTMRTYIDGRLIDTVSFEVAGLQSAFVTGLEASYLLENFPAPGQSVTVRWSEADQNFIIVEAQP